MCEGACEDEDGHDNEKSVETTNVNCIRSFCVAVQAGRIVPHEEAKDSHESIPSQLDENVGEDECLPSIGLRLSLPRFVQSPLRNPHRHDLVDELDDHE